MVERSISVWSEVSFSTRSDPLSTLTTVELAAMGSVSGGATCTVEFISTRELDVPKPAALTVRR